MDTPGDVVSHGLVDDRGHHKPGGLLDRDERRRLEGGAMAHAPSPT
jgi:hypothetical protein